MNDNAGIELVLRMARVPGPVQALETLKANGVDDSDLRTIDGEKMCERADLSRAMIGEMDRALRKYRRIAKHVQSVSGVALLSMLQDVRNASERRVVGVDAANRAVGGHLAKFTDHAVFEHDVVDKVWPTLGAAAAVLRTLITEPFGRPRSSCGRVVDVVAKPAPVC
jgi:hypothetical protein